MVIRCLLVLVLLLHLRPSLCRCLLLGSRVGFALLSPAAHSSYPRAYGRTCSCISRDAANHSAAYCATSGTLGSSAFLLRSRVSRLRLGCLDISRGRCLGRRRIGADACLLLSQVVAVRLIDELLIVTLALCRSDEKARFICG